MGNYFNCPNSFCNKGMKKEKPIRVNVCWELKDIRKCETLPKDKAYALKKHLDEEGGFCFWFQALDD
jgi:hypothetical protein